MVYGVKGSPYLFWILLLFLRLDSRDLPPRNRETQPRVPGRRPLGCGQGRSRALAGSNASGPFPLPSPLAADGSSWQTLCGGVRHPGGLGAWYRFSPGPAGDPASLPAASPRRVPQQGGTPRRAPPPRQDQARAFAVCARERVSWGPASRLPGPPALHRCGAGMLRRKGCTPWWGYALCRYFVLK